MKFFPVFPDIFNETSLLNIVKKRRRRKRKEVKEKKKKKKKEEEEENISKHFRKSSINIKIRFEELPSIAGRKARLFCAPCICYTYLYIFCCWGEILPSFDCNYCSTKC